MQQLDDIYSVTGKPDPRTPTSVLDDVDAFMANWSTWDPATPPSTSLPSSPNCKPSKISLVETLQNCIDSLPQSHTLATSAPSPPSQLAAPPGPKPPAKRRSRASRRAPTTVLETHPSEFRDVVQRLTGIPSATVPVRPQPKRPCPSTFIRPDTLRSIRRLPPFSSPPGGSFLSQRTPPPAPVSPSASRFLQQIMQTQNHMQMQQKQQLQEQERSAAPAFDLKRENELIAFDMKQENDQIAFELKRENEIAPAPGQSAWWDGGFASAGNMNFGGNSESYDLMEFRGANEEDNMVSEVTMSQIESWLAGQDHNVSAPENLMRA